MGVEIHLDWVGGAHTFALPIGQLRKLQQTTDAGPHELLIRMAQGNWRVDDLVEVIRLGLIGGGMTASEAGPLVLRLFEQHPLIDFREVAYRVIGAAVMGVEDDPVGESEGATMPPENGSSATSTVSEP